MRFIRSFVLVALLLCVGSASARDLFVDNLSGSDGANGRYPHSSTDGGPIRTIQQALLVAQPGDHINVANTGTPYRESVSVSGGDNSGFAINPLTIVGNGAVLDGSMPVPPGAWENVHEDVFRFRPPRGGTQRLFLGGKPAVKRDVDAESGLLPPLGAGEWCSHHGFMYFAAGPGKLPREYPLSYAALPVGITLYQVKNVAILDLTVEGFQTDGVNAHDSVFNARLGGLILRGNGRSGLAVGGSSQVEADGCLIGDNGAAQVWLSGYGTLSLKLCDLLEASAPKIVRRGGRLFIDGALQD